MTGNIDAVVNIVSQAIESKNGNILDWPIPDLDLAETRKDNKINIEIVNRQIVAARAARLSTIKILKKKKINQIKNQEN